MKMTIIIPGGNDTALLEGIPPKNKRKVINDAVMKQYPNVEQVGFYTYDANKKLARLEMAGGEFCGNATRSLAYLLLNGKIGELRIKVSGTKQILRAGSKMKNTAYAQMPIFSSFSSVEKLEKDIYKVSLEGIIHIITQKPTIATEKALKVRAKNLLKKYNLLSSTPASGVMFISTEKNKVTSDPIVWVRDIETFFYETACASGTTAIGLWKALGTNRSKIKLSIKQPSKKNISISVEKNNNTFRNAYIDGPIKTIPAERKIT